MTDPHGRHHPGTGPNPQHDPYAPSAPQSFPQAMPPAPGGAYPAPGTPVYGYVAPYRPTHSLATASLVLSLVGFLCTVTAIGGVITGHMARKQIRQNPHQYQGEGMALAGLIIGWIITGFLIAVVCLYIVMFVLVGTGALAS